MTPYFASDGTTIYCGDAVKVCAELPAESIDLVVTSPPYFAQRQYTDHPDEIGVEERPEEYLEKLWQVTESLARLIKPDGALVINLGDKVNADGPIKRISQKAGSFNGARRQPQYRGVSLKSLMFLPHRYAIGCIDRLGLCVRSEIVWSKSGAGGADAKSAGRAHRSHEFIFHLTRRLRHGESVTGYGDPGADVWTISPSRSRNDHPAKFPLEIPLRCIDAWCPPGGVVLDPFMGSGTTLFAARQLGRLAIGIDLSLRFCALAAQAL